MQQKIKHDEHIIFNEDQDLKPIKVNLPSPPSDETKILGYNKPRKEQKFKRPQMPEKLFRLNIDKKKSNSEKIETLREDPEYYSEEIEFIQQEWERRINGVWYYINGKPTYIPGVYYFYLTSWYLERGYPDFRERDRKFFIFAEFCENDKDCFGFIYPKHRREGATTKAACWNYEYVSRRRRVRGGIQSKTETDGAMVFQRHLVPGWRKLPFWYKPVSEGSTNPKSELSFNAPAMRITRTNMGTDQMDDLESSIDFMSATEGAYDGSRLERYHGDEIGKVIGVDVYKRHLIVRQCLSQGMDIIGKAIYTSTSGEMAKGGESFKKLIETSDYHMERANNRTVSGLYTLFIPATEGLTGAVDEFGNSVIEDPTEPIFDAKGKEIKQGSLSYLLNERKQALEEEDYEKLNESTRQFPIRLRDCFKNSSDSENWDMKIIGDMSDKYQFGNDDAVRGNFVWKNGVQDTRVIFQPDQNGRFLVSYQFPRPELTNRSINYRGVKMPGNSDLFRAGGDTFKFRTSGGKKSLGGGACFMKRDYSIDPDTKPIEDWETNRFVCTYLHKPPTKDEYCEDMLMMSVYYGAQMVPEINVPAIWDHFERRGYAGYLYYALDKKTGKYKKNPGYNTGQTERETIYREYQQHIKYHGYRIFHDDLIKQLEEIGDDMGDFDLFAAGGMIFLSLKDENDMYHSKTEEETTIGISDFMDYR